MKNHTGLRGGLALCLAVSCTGAWAQDDFGDAGSDAGAPNLPINYNDRRMYVSPMVSYTLADEDRLTDDASGGVIAIGKKMTAGLNLELTGFFQTMDAEDPAADSAQLSGVGLGAMIFPSTNWTRVYLLLAVHQAQTDDHPSTPASTGFSYKGTVFDSGLGYLWPMNLGGFEVALRAEARYRMDSHHKQASGVGGKDEFYEAVFNAGVLIPLGKRPGDTAAPVEVVVAVGDGDGDGVTDDLDQCPDTPAGASVNESGCEGDTDGDGVVDRLDQCPDTPAGTTVDEKGCPIAADADGDGVPDAIDQCPDTAPGATVNETGCTEGCRAPAPGEPIDLEGCATGEAVVLKGVNFDTGSSRLTANAKVILNQVADSLAGAPAMRVEIGGHTDAQGSDAYNQQLSERRAQAVKDYLIARGIDASRLESRGYGETAPVDSNETVEGRELNRRVEMKILEGAGP